MKAGPAILGLILPSVIMSCLAIWAYHAGVTEGEIRTVSRLSTTCEQLGEFKVAEVVFDCRAEGELPAIATGTTSIECNEEGD